MKTVKEVSEGCFYHCPTLFNAWKCVENCPEESGLFFIFGYLLTIFKKHKLFFKIGIYKLSG